MYNFVDSQNLEVQKIEQLLKKVAPTDVSVLIHGESGTGKERLAQLLHHFSPRKNHALVALNCGAFNEKLLMSELFGHERGAFTGASHAKKGLVEMAHQGTLFLDEVGEMPLECQGFFLRFLQEKEYYRLGGMEKFHVSVRIVAATNQDLEKQVKAQKFRQDLYFRLNTISVKTIPLRERAEDIPALAHCFANEYGRKIHPTVESVLKHYFWPGNIRELQNVITTAAIVSESETIQLAHLPKQLFEIRDTIRFSETDNLEEMIKQHIRKVLAKYRGNKTRAARALGVSTRTLYNRLEP